MFSSIFNVAAVFNLFIPAVYRGSSPDYATRNLNTIRSIYNLTVYPNNVPIIQNGGSAVPRGLFNANATGRITPLGNFTGFEDSIEYFFGLAPVPQNNPAGSAFYKADIVEFSSGCPDVASSVVYLHTARVNPETGERVSGAREVPLKQIAFWRFDSEGSVLKYDAWIPNLPLWIKASIGIDFTNPLVQLGFPSTLCSDIQHNCQGKDRQYANEVDCIARLTRKPFGSMDEIWGDNLACRIIHARLTGIRPEIHCPHVGPRGGNGPDNFKCVDIDYVQGYISGDEKLWGSTVDTFSCP
ncbi:hypothetical protein AAF712_016620 [Marasmius tenuissimus]|uniref:Uncharacterized protein n=1 Tax=Marasmius tenuissimus TaxID=585030 RepID=A0ABR2Z5J2_9AGAR|nr:hypothetical protein PM082_016636 [Marasmius tenuissimus]